MHRKRLMDLSITDDVSVKASGAPAATWVPCALVWHHEIEEAVVYDCHGSSL